jgi:hypothetical protein
VNWDIVEPMSTVKELMLSPAGTVLELVDVEGDALGEVAMLDVADALGVVGALVVELDDEHPAAVRATTAAATPTAPSRLKRRTVRSSCECDDRPPPILLSSPIPISLRLNAPG